MRFSMMVSAACLSLAAPLGVTLALVPVASAEAATVEQARGFIDGVASQALDVVRSGDAKEQKEKRLEQLFSKNVDMPWVGRFVVGRFWRQASPEQQQRYLRAYQEFVVAHYASRIADANGGDYKILNATEAGDGQFVVNMQIMSDNKPVALDYRLHADKGGQLKVIDVVVEGVSMITTQRSEFASILNNQGLDYLIAQLENRSLDVNLDQTASR